MASASRRQTGWARAAAAALALAASWLIAPPAHAEPPTFLAETDRNQVAAGEVFLYEVTITTSGQRVESYQPPDFKGLQVVNAPQSPNQSTQMQMGAGGTPSMVSPISAGLRRTMRASGSPATRMIAEIAMSSVARETFREATCVPIPDPGT